MDHTESIEPLISYDLCQGNGLEPKHEPIIILPSSIGDEESKAQVR